jgi:hypothetical protein
LRRVRLLRLAAGADVFVPLFASLRAGVAALWCEPLAALTHVVQNATGDVRLSVPDAQGPGARRRPDPPA